MSIATYQKSVYILRINIIASSGLGNYVDQCLHEAFIVNDTRSFWEFCPTFEFVNSDSWYFHQLRTHFIHTTIRLEFRNSMNYSIYRAYTIEVFKKHTVLLNGIDPDNQSP